MNLGTYQVLPHQARVDLGAMAMKRYSALPQNSIITGASLSDCLMSYTGHSPLQKCNWCILPPQPIGLALSREKRKRFANVTGKVQQAFWTFSTECIFYVVCIGQPNVPCLIFLLIFLGISADLPWMAKRVYWGLIYKRSSTLERKKKKEIWWPLRPQFKIRNGLKKG